MLDRHSKRETEERQAKEGKVGGKKIIKISGPTARDERVEDSLKYSGTKKHKHTLGNKNKNKEQKDGHNFLAGFLFVCGKLGKNQASSPRLRLVCSKKQRGKARVRKKKKRKRDKSSS